MAINIPYSITPKAALALRGSNDPAQAPIAVPKIQPAAAMIPTPTKKLVVSSPSLAIPRAKTSSVLKNAASIRGPNPVFSPRRCPSARLIKA